MTKTSSPAALLTADLLNLRAWAVAVLSGSVEPAPDAKSDSLRSFLAIERCAAALLDALERSSESVLSPPALEILRESAATETQSVLRARVEARDIAKLVQKLGIRAMVLKGGVRAITGEAPFLPLVDIDLLVERNDVARVVTALESAGYGVASRALPHHQSIKPAEDRLAVEVHWTTHDDGTPEDPAVWTRAIPLSGEPPLERPGQVDYVVQLLEHALVTHSERAVSLRDTLLIGFTALRLSDDELRAVRARITSIPVASTAALLDFSLQLARHERANDPFVESCATLYASIAVARQLPKTLSSSSALAFVTESEIARAPLSRRFSRLIKWKGTGVSSLVRLTDRIPGAGQLIVVPVRAIYYGVVTAFALPKIRAARSEALRIARARNS